MGSGRDDLDSRPKPGGVVGKNSRTYYYQEVKKRSKDTRMWGMVGHPRIPLHGYNGGEEPPPPFASGHA